MRLPNDEWLHLAKGTAIGQQRRMRHRSEGRENLVVGNTPDRWWAYCQSCRAGGIEMKTHVMVGQPAPKESTSLVRPSDARALLSLHQYERDALTLQLAKKAMDWTYFANLADIEWSAERQRLLIHTVSGVMGRDTSERSPQKWLTYDRQHYTAPYRPDSGYANVFLVEDTYSYFKVQHAITQHDLHACVACTLGTSIHDSLYFWLLKNARRVWSFYDGDSAGWKGALNNARRLRGGGLCGGGEVLDACAPLGKDPKDLNLSDIAAHVVGLLAT